MTGAAIPVLVIFSLISMNVVSTAIRQRNFNATEVKMQNTGTGILNILASGLEVTSAIGISIVAANLVPA